jgi:serine/threonine protein kinase
MFQNLKAGPVSVAVKRAINIVEYGDFYQKEANTLQLLKDHTWQNLIHPIAAYRHGTEHCIVFPWASGGSLMSYWKAHDRKSSDKDCVLWILGEFAGIFRALKELHNNDFRHGDLKPDNILWFKEFEDKGQLQIADLGLAAFHKDQNTNVRRKYAIQTMTPSGTKRYEPPETNELRNTNEARSRSYDVWSMGCIVLELLIWLVYGNDALEAFTVRTDFFWQELSSTSKPGQDVYVIHKVVQECMTALQTALKGYPAQTALLDLVRQKLLVIQCTEYGKSKPGCRESAEKVDQKMNGILEKCKKNDTYLIPFKEKLRRPETLNQNVVGVVLRTKGGALAPPKQNEGFAKLPSNKQDLDSNDHVRLDRKATIQSSTSSNPIKVEASEEQEQVSRPSTDNYEL